MISHRLWCPDVPAASPTPELPHWSSSSASRGFDTTGSAESPLRSSTDGLNGVASLPQGTGATVLPQGPAWQSQSHQLEQMSLELQQAQQHLFRQQVAAITSDIGALRQEVAQLQSNQESTRKGLTSMVESRCKEIHDCLGDLGDKTGKHGQSQEVVKAQVEQLHNIFSAFERNASAFGDLQGSLDTLAGHRAALDAKHAALDDRVGNMADKLLYVAGKHQQHAEAFEDHKGAHGKLVDEFRRHSMVANEHAHSLASAHAKMDQVMKQVSEHQGTRVKDSDAIGELRRGYQALASDSALYQDRCIKVDERLRSLESSVGASTSEHGRRLQLAHKSVQDIHDRLKSEGHMQQTRYSNMEERLKSVESTVGESVVRAELDAAHRKLGDMSGQLKSEQIARTRELGSMEARVCHMERVQNDGNGNCDQQISELKIAHANLRDMCRGIEDRKHATDTQQVVVGERLKGMEKMIGETLADHFKELQQTKRQLQVLHSRFDAEKNARESHRGRVSGRRTGFTELDQIPEQSGSPMKSSLSSPSLGAAEVFSADTTNWDRDYFRHVSRLIIKGDVADSRSLNQAGRNSPRTTSSMSRVRSLPALVPSMLDPLVLPGALR